jgi:hypothetical protein
MGSLKPGDILRRRCQPAEPDGWEIVRVGVSPIEGLIAVWPVDLDAMAVGMDVDERELLAAYDVIEHAPEPDEPGDRFAWWVGQCAT